MTDHEDWSEVEEGGIKYLRKLGLYEASDYHLFGWHRVRGEYIAQSNTKYGEVSVAVFFDKYLADNPGSSGPNWYYYWQVTSANTGVHIYGGDGGDYYGSYDWENAENFFVIYDKAADLNAITGSYGIDTFAEVCLHEKNHMDNYLEWWPEGDRWYPGHPRDSDEDMVPSVLEPSLNLDPDNPNTCSEAYNDFECLGRREMSEWNVGTANSVDWACPGNNPDACGR